MIFFAIAFESRGFKKNPRSRDLTFGVTRFAIIGPPAECADTYRFPFSYPEKSPCRKTVVTISRLSCKTMVSRNFSGPYAYNRRASSPAFSDGGLGWVIVRKTNKNGRSLSSAQFKFLRRNSSRIKTDFD